MRDKDYFQSYMSDARWQIYENGWSPEQQSVHETLLTIGNGYLCSRGALEETPDGSHPGTYFAGLFDRSVSQVPELVNAPNPFDFRIIVEGEKLDVTAMDVLDHRRILDMRRACITRRTIFSSAFKKRFSYQSLRFISHPHHHAAVMRTYFTPLDGPVNITIQTATNTNVMNVGLVTEGMKQPFNIHETTKQGDVDYLAVKTLDKEELIAFGSLIQVEHRNRTYFEPHRTLKLHIKKGETICITKYVSMQTSRDFSSSRIKRLATENVEKIARKGFEPLFKEHSKAWAIMWKQADLTIVGDPDMERTLRFNIYHLLISGNKYSDDTGIGAKTLSGEGYRGHSFWDTEIFTLPYYTFNFPVIARNLLTYRYKRLDQARQNAKDNGYEGAMFPWESADTGEEATPEWHKTHDGTLNKITTGQHEHHITADVAYGMVQYYLVTNDTAFMLNAGLETLLETARFWTSRVHWNNTKQHYEIKGVIGPDEFHEEINNSAYTNMMAVWNLQSAASFFRALRSKHPQQVKKTADKIALKTGEPEEWRRIAGQLHIKRKNDIIEEFDGYFRKKHLPLPEYDDYFIPVSPKMSLKKLGTTQYVKQADIIMLMYLLYNDFKKEEIVKNYHFYEQRTIHNSSLSPSMHALMAARIGDMKKAKRYIRASAYIDLNDIFNNTADGMHAASLGGTWQAVIMGFGGVTINKGALHIDPSLPSEWSNLSFGILFQGDPIRIDIAHDQIKLRWDTKNSKGKLHIKVYNQSHSLSPNRSILISALPKGTKPNGTKKKSPSRKKK